MGLSLNLTGLTPKQIRFLRCFEACASVTQAARWAKIAKRTHFDWMEISESYRDAFERTKPVAAQTLEDEAVRRAHQGLRKAVWHKGRVVGYETEYSDSLMQTLLKGSNPDKFRERQDVRVAASVSVTDMAQLRGEVLAMLAEMTPEGRFQVARRLMLTDGSESNGNGHQG